MIRRCCALTQIERARGQFNLGGDRGAGGWFLENLKGGCVPIGSVAKLFLIFVPLSD
jgi:hypothetical protein